MSKYTVMQVEEDYKFETDDCEQAIEMAQAITRITGKTCGIFLNLMELCFFSNLQEHKCETSDETLTEADIKSVWEGDGE